MDSIIKEILAKNNEADISARIDSAIPEYLDDGWEDEFDDIAEAYSETGRGGAGSQVLHEIIREYFQENKITEPDTDQFCEILDALSSEWGVELS